MKYYFKGMIWNILKSISSLSFSISLFLVLAFISILGTVIEQNQTLDYYKLHYPVIQNSILLITWKQINWLGLDHMYSTYWFFLLLSLFFLSLLICTFSTQLPILKHSRQWSFLYSQKALNTKDLYSPLKSASFINLIYILNSKNYFVFHKGLCLYAYTGLIGRIAPIFVHASIIFTFIGFIFRMLGGLVVQEIIPNGELFHLQNITASGNLSSISNAFVGKVDDFFITFNKDKSVKQFFSNISFMNNKRDIISTDYIWVNSPMRLKGLTIYQTDWYINALRIQIGQDKFIVKQLKSVTLENQATHSAWFCNLELYRNYQVSILIPDILDNIWIYDKEGILITSTTYGLWNIVYGVPVLFKDLMFSTGLEMKTDPGLLISYFGFLVLIVSIVSSYISYSQIWANQNINKLNLSGKTNRAFLSFEDELFDIYKKMKFFTIL